MPYTGSKAFAGMGTILARGDGASPEAFTPIAEIKNIQRSGAKADQADVTNMDSISAYREWLPTLLDAGEISFTGNYIPADATQQSLQTDFDARASGQWTITLPASSISDPGNATPGFWEFTAFVTGLDFDLSIDKEATISGKLKISGQPVFTDETT